MDAAIPISEGVSRGIIDLKRKQAIIIHQQLYIVQAILLEKVVIVSFDYKSYKTALEEEWASGFTGDKMVKRPLTGKTWPKQIYYPGHEFYFLSSVAFNQEMTSPVDLISVDSSIYISGYECNVFSTDATCIPMCKIIRCDPL